MTKANDKINSAANAAKVKTERVIDDIAGAVAHVADKAGRHVHDAGVKVKDAGEKLAKLAD
jgi:hypothetical protein